MLFMRVMLANQRVRSRNSEKALAGVLVLVGSGGGNDMGKCGCRVWCSLSAEQHMVKCREPHMV